MTKTLTETPADITGEGTALELEINALEIELADSPDVITKAKDSAPAIERRNSLPALIANAKARLAAIPARIEAAVAAEKFAAVDVIEADLKAAEEAADTTAASAYKILDEYKAVEAKMKEANSALYDARGVVDNKKIELARAQIVAGIPGVKVPNYPIRGGSGIPAESIASDRINFRKAG